MSLETVSSSDRESDLKYADRWLAAQDAALEAAASAAAAADAEDHDAAPAAAVGGHERGGDGGGVFTPSEYAQTSLASTSTSSYATSGITSPNDITSPPSHRNGTLYDGVSGGESRLFSPLSVKGRLME